jgi:hypothetical protein
MATANEILNMNSYSYSSQNVTESQIAGLVDKLCKKINALEAKLCGEINALEARLKLVEDPNSFANRLKTVEDKLTLVDDVGLMNNDEKK